MIECSKRDDLRPMCPHCSTELRTVWYQQLAGVMGRRFIYFCGTCRRCWAYPTVRGSGWDSLRSHAGRFTLKRVSPV